MKKLRILLLALLLGWGVLACQTTTSLTTTTEGGYLLADFTGKTQAEIEAIFVSVQMNVQFRLIETTSVDAGLFIRYVNASAGDRIPFGSTLRIEIAKAPPVSPGAPTIQGATDQVIYVAVQGNAVEFDLQQGVTATDYLGNNIPWGNFFFIFQIQNADSQVVTAIDYYKTGEYFVTYMALTGDLSTQIVRKLSIVIPPFDTNYTDELRLSASYAGLSFIRDGIGEVTVTTYTDADTTNFRDSVSGDRFTVRYLGIDAPEATSKFDPWGIKAANYVRETLSSAEKIILQAEGSTRTDGNGRYLAWVWYVKNGVTRLLNLELVEMAYAWGAGAASSALYGTTFLIAAAETQLTGKRIYGEVDPDYDYSKEGVPISISELVANFENYIGRKVTVTGVVTTKVGNSVYLEKDGKGIYLYCGYVLTNELQIGHEVAIQGLIATLFYEGKQLSNYYQYNMQLLSTDNPVTITDINGSQSPEYVGRVVRFTDLVIQSIDPSPTNAAYTVICKDSLNNTVHVRVDDYTASFMPSYLFVIGKQITVYGPITQFYQTYQLMLPGTGNVEFK